MRSLWVYSLLIGGMVITCGCLAVEGEKTNEAKQGVKKLTITDFEDENVLGSLITTPGVTVALTNRGTVNGKKALEVKVAPFSVHKDQWPSVVFGPKFFTSPVDLSGYSKVVATVWNVTEGWAPVNITLSTLPYNDGGRNLEGDVFSIPGGTTWACNLPTRRFEVNDPSSIYLMYFTFPPREIEAVYRIEAIQAIYDSTEGSPAEELKAKSAALSGQFAAVRQEINWKAIPEEAHKAWEEKISTLEKSIGKIREGCAQSGTPAFLGRYKPIHEELSNVSREMGALLFADKKDFVAWEIDPYINILRNETPAPANRLLEKIQVRMAQGEFRDMVFMVSPCEKDLRLAVRVEASDARLHEALLVQETLYRPTRRPGQETGDAVSPLKGPLMIPKGESRQIRLRFDARFSGINPGRYSFKILLRDLETGVDKTIPGTLEVWNFQLPSYDVLPNNSYAQFEEFGHGELLAKAVREMKRYGQNAVYVHPCEMPRPAKVDNEGKILAFDDVAFENRVRSVLDAWKAAPGSEKLWFFFSISAMYELGLNRSDIKFPEAKWKGVFAQWLKHFKETVRRLGIADDAWWMALGDEASESSLLKLEIPMAEAIKSIDPGIMIYSNTSIVLSDPVMSERFYKAFDLLQPDLPTLKSNPYLLDWVRKSKKPLWTYKCLCDLGVKGKNIYEYYRVYAWDLVKYGITGTGVWTYCAQAEQQHDFGCLLVDRHGEEVMHSRRYEIYREGLDDYRYVWLFRELAKKKGPQAQKSAEKLIREAVQDITSKVEDTSRCEKWRLRIASDILNLKSRPK